MGTATVAAENADVTRRLAQSARDTELQMLQQKRKQELEKLAALSANASGTGNCIDRWHELKRVGIVCMTNRGADAACQAHHTGRRRGGDNARACPGQGQASVEVSSSLRVGVPRSRRRSLTSE